MAKKTNPKLSVLIKDPDGVGYYYASVLGDCRAYFDKESGIVDISGPFSIEILTSLLADVNALLAKEN